MGSPKESRETDGAEEEGLDSRWVLGEGLWCANERNGAIQARMSNEMGI